MDHDKVICREAIRKQCSMERCLSHMLSEAGYQQSKKSPKRESPQQFSAYSATNGLSIDKAQSEELSSYRGAIETWK